MDIDSKDEESPRKRFQMNTSTPSFPDDKCLSSDTPPTLDSNMETDDMEYKSDIDTAAPDALPTRYLTTKIFNTTSSVFASETIASPDVHQILFCLGSVLQAQMVEDDEATEEVKSLHPEFDIFMDMKPECGGVVASVPNWVLESDAPDDMELRQKLINNIVPSVDTITRFIGYLSMFSKLSTEVDIIALVYVNRLASNCNLILKMSNWRAVWLTCVMLAQKMWNDRPIKTGSFAKILPLEKLALRNLEARGLQLLEFSVGVKPSLYVKYYFELRQLFTTIMGFKASDWRVKPLSVRQAYRLEALCKRRDIKLSPAIMDQGDIAFEKTAEHHQHDEKSYKRNGASEKKASSIDDGTYVSHARFVIS